MTMTAANVAFPSPTFDPYTHFPAESIYSAPPPLSQPQPLPQTLPSTASENKPYGLKYGSNVTPTAVSSSESRVNLPCYEGSNGEPRSRPVTGAHEECIVSVPRGDARGAGCYSSEDMDRTLLEDVQVKTPPSNDGSIK